MFYSRFNYLMSTLGLKNTDIAKAMYIDRSLVSRWRTGKREPTDEIIKNLSSVILGLCKDGESKLLLCRLLHLQYSDKLFDDTRLLQLTLTKWLAGSDESIQMNQTSDVNKNLEDALLQPIPVSLYSQEDGYRSCLKTLMEMALTANKPFTLYFFGNDNMEWFSRKKQFFRNFVQLVKRAKEIGITVRLIFHISNDSKKMSNYIDLWSLVQSIPGTELYGFYGLANRENNRRIFNHVNFAIPDTGAITGWSVRNSPHQYIMLMTDQKQTRNVIDDFEILQSSSIPITKNLTDFDLEKMIDFKTRDVFRESSREFLSHSTALPLGTMSADIMKEMMEVSGATEDETDHCLKLLEQYKIWFNEYNAQGMMEYYYIDWNNEVDLNKPILIPHSNKMFGHSLYYTKEQYKKHLLDTLHFTREHESFNFYPIEKRLYPVDIHVAYGAYLISFGEIYSSQITTCTHQHFANCVFMHINEQAQQLPQRIFSRDNVFKYFQKKYPDLGPV